ncbi:lipopolysaccharide-induced tumor necrosis factor-alpha factor homolog [Adelges cooleyi]|uniref:lipopolysaccharide-induced tumor necrosis factor-alpha factor homolog n=1 Tax=Adelges cooleyi TaxID=133065 RepID=UPI00218058C5|nr:lipopolysaccharide-induced tumor necrosis factor-alpha factor homolog [Adelges cooleyi]
MYPTDSSMPPPPYPVPQHEAQSSVIFVQNPIVGPKSTRLICPNCRADVFTRTTESATAKAWMCSFLMFLTGLFCCSCIPLCMESFQKVDHHCPSCGAYVGSYHVD